MPSASSSWRNCTRICGVDGSNASMTAVASRRPRFETAAQGGLPPFKATIIGGDVFSQIGTSNYCGVMSWDLEKESRPLLLWPGDTTHGAGNFDTDGKDMVWTYSAGPKGCGVDASNPEVWTAPYTTDPDVLAVTARRLRKDIFGMSPYTYEVGFGYAMRTTGAWGLFVVRLADGMATFLGADPKLTTRSERRSSPRRHGDHGGAKGCAATVLSNRSGVSFRTNNSLLPCPPCLRGAPSALMLIASVWELHPHFCRSKLTYAGAIRSGSRKTNCSLRLT
jgi:hypothetical protein